EPAGSGRLPPSRWRAAERTSHFEPMILADDHEAQALAVPKPRLAPGQVAWVQPPGAAGSQPPAPPGRTACAAGLQPPGRAVWGCRRASVLVLVAIVLTQGLGSLLPDGLLLLPEPGVGAARLVVGLP